MKKSSRTTNKISSERFDEKFEKGEDVSDFLDFDKAIVVRKVNVDFPSWMIERLDREAAKLNVTRQAIIKMWIHDHLVHLPKVA